MTDERMGKSIERARRVTLERLVELRAEEHLAEAEFERRVEAARVAASMSELKALLRNS